MTNAKTTITLWAPTLRDGAPSNAAGLCGHGRLYTTREAALRHEHWNNQAPWADVKQITVPAEDVTYLGTGVYRRTHLRDEHGSRFEV